MDHRRGRHQSNLFLQVGESSTQDSIGNRMRVGDPDGFPLPACGADQALDLFANRLRFLDMIEKHIPLTEHNLQETCGRPAEAFGGCATVYEKEMSLLEYGKDLIHLRGDGRHFGAHVVVDALDKGHGRQVLIELVDEFIR